MKIKQSADDFRVTELTDVAPSAGAFALYRLEKTGWTTIDAIAAVRRRWKIPAHRISFGGLKDRHARTVQHFTIAHGPRRGLKQTGIEVGYLGQTPKPFSSEDIRANQFEIVVRDLSSERIDQAQQFIPDTERDGLPNYFDDQRFGSVTGANADFAALHLIRGDYEQGLKLAMIAPYEHDRAPARKEKQILRNHWGDWPACTKKLPRGKAREIAGYLAERPADFRGAFARWSSESSGLLLSAFQSHLWNRVLARWIERHFEPSQRLPLRLKLGDVPAARNIVDSMRAQLMSQVLPLPCARLHYEDKALAAPADWVEVMRAVLDEFGITLDQLRLPGLRRPFFSRGERHMWFFPVGLKATAKADERSPGRHKLVLSFELPRGSYATIVLKRVLQTPAIATS